MLDTEKIFEPSKNIYTQETPTKEPDLSQKIIESHHTIMYLALIVNKREKANEMIKMKYIFVF